MDSRLISMIRDQQEQKATGFWQRKCSIGRIINGRKKKRSWQRLRCIFSRQSICCQRTCQKDNNQNSKTEKKSDVAEKQTNPTVAKKQTADSKTGAMIVKISSVEPNMDQPRKQFDEDALMELSESIKQYGVLHPLLVSDKKDYYEIIAGERRWRAAKLAGLTEIPVIVKEFSEQELVRNFPD